jgi:hypothetical protein
MKPQKKKRTGRWRRVGLVLLIALPLAIGGLWIATHQLPWLGPMIADGLRAVLGTERVSRIEDFVYGVEDRWNQWWRGDEAPKAYWEVPASAEPEPQPTTNASSDVPALAPFRPADVGSMHRALAAAGDGVWVPVPDPQRPGAPFLMHKTLIHPDPKRPWAELFVVALDVRRIVLYPMAGALEPKSNNSEGKAYDRKALIPEDHRDALLAGFNGGFKAEHGLWGYRVDGVTLLEARKFGCTLGATSDGALVLAPWKDLGERASALVWWRQTPPCMLVDGARNGGLWDPDAKGWGAALDGATVIRRSAIGLDRARTTLYVAMSNHTSAQAIANGMQHAGASDVAQLDVNWPFPRFVLFPEEGGRRVTKSLFDGFEVGEDDYLRERHPRDLFYVTRVD